MKQFFIKYWWVFPILITLCPIISMLSNPIFYEVDWSWKVPMLLFDVLVFLMTLIVLLVSWIILLKNRQWWKLLISLLASILIICPLFLPLQSWLGI